MKAMEGKSATIHVGYRDCINWYDSAKVAAAYLNH